MRQLHVLFTRVAARIRAVPHIDIIGLATAAGAYIALVMAHISTWSIWFDEAFTAYITRFGYADIARYTATDVHPPMYYWAVKAWTSLWGTDELAFRSFSMVCGVVALVFGFVLVRKLFGKQAAVLGAWLMALSPMFIRYGEEARMYTMVTAIVMAATYLLVRATETNARRYWVGYGLLVAVGMWTHYFAALAWLAHWAWRAVAVRIDGARGRAWLARFFTKEWIWTHVLAVGVFAAWIPPLLHQFSIIQSGFWIPPVSAHTITNYLTNVLFYLEQQKVLSWFALLYMTVVGAAGVVLYRTYRLQRSNQARKNLLLLICLAWVPPVLLLLASMPPLKSSFIERYLIPAATALAMLSAVCIVSMSRRRSSRKLAVVLTLLIVVSFGFGIDRVYYYGNYNKNSNTSIRTRELIAAIDARARPGEPLIATDPWVFYEAVFYTSDKHPVYFLDQMTDYKYGSLDMLKYNDQFKIKDLDAFLADHPTVWYFGNVGDNQITPPSIARGWRQINQVAAYDDIDGKSAYKAAQFAISAE